MLDRGIVHVPQERSLFPLMTVWDNVLMGAHLLRDRREVRRRAEAVAERFPILEERRGERAGSLSGGQQKIVEIARAMMVQPRLMLMDEPSMGLDPKARRGVFETVTRLNDEGQTLLLVEQNARAGLQIAHRGVIMDIGRVALEGAAHDLLDDPKVAALYPAAASTASRPPRPRCRTPRVRASAGRVPLKSLAEGAASPPGWRRRERCCPRR